jgi:hypothetical protein
MKWFKRGCWIAAWGVWVWCGFGLYRELPREFGPQVRSLSFPGDSNRIHAFLDGDAFAVWHYIKNPRSETVAVWNIRTGDRREMLDPKPGIHELGEYSFQVTELWDDGLRYRLPRLSFTTTAFRRNLDGSLIVRTTSPNIPRRLHWNSSRTLAVSDDGKVYQFPCPVNYRLLAVCQAILAAPIILTWAVLRWRRCRKAIAQ